MENLNYGVIGNCKSAALISDKGEIVWLCLPDFNSPSVFAKLLDEKKGGSFAIEVDDSYTIKQSYIENTNIISTLFQSGNDAFEVIDFMPRFKTEEGDYFAPPDIIRYIKYISGAPKARFIYNPKLYWAEHNTNTVIEDEYIKSYTTDGTYESLYLYTNFDFNKIINGEEITIDRDSYFLLSYNQKIEEMKLNKIYLKLQRTKVYWYNWVERTYRLPKYNNEIIRSALILKLLTYQKSGAILAAITTSVPKIIGGTYNWDYRYCWIREASMIIKILTSLGHTTGARRFLNFIVDITPGKDEKIQLVYGIKGEKSFNETTLDYLDGYLGSKPVRIGNSSFQYKQLDIYGVLMDVLYQNFQMYVYSQENAEELWTIVRSIARIIDKNWQEVDFDIWDVSNEQSHFTFSKVLCWVAIDRAMKIAEKLGKTKYQNEWKNLADKIKDDIYKKAWNDKLQSFTRAYGSEELDASNLLMESYGFIDANDPKYISMVIKTKETLLHDGLLFRYRVKDFSQGNVSAFTVCVFWLIKSLAKIGRQAEAEQLFNEILKCSNHLGIFSEHIDFKTKRLLGNLPHGSTHLALIEAAIVLSKGEKN
jgi:GH15 family glucan-1,4-alpha-glucosidase